VPQVKLDNTISQCFLGVRHEIKADHAVPVYGEARHIHPVADNKVQNTVSMKKSSM